MAKREKRRIILFLIEGKSEKVALELPISEMVAQYSSSGDYELFFLKKKERDSSEEDGGGDITSQAGITPENIERIITKLYFKSYMEQYRFYPKDISHVFHIMDLDGAYLDDSLVFPIKSEHIYYNKNGKIKPYYNAEEGIIEAPVIEAIIDRNRRKRKNIDYLASLERIRIDNKSPFYSAYFFSSNLDHFIHNNANLHEGKTDAAEAFSMNYVKDIDGFSKFFCDDPDSSGECDYSLSWEQARHSTYSVQRHTNINLLMDSIKNGII